VPPSAARIKREKMKFIFSVLTPDLSGRRGRPLFALQEPSINYKYCKSHLSFLSYKKIKMDSIISFVVLGGIAVLCIFLILFFMKRFTTKTYPQKTAAMLDGIEGVE
jgi:hypothetical protein